MGVIIFICILLTGGLGAAGWFIGKPKRLEVLGLCLGLFLGLIGMLVLGVLGTVLFGGLGLVVVAVVPAPAKSGASDRDLGAVRVARPSPELAREKTLEERLDELRDLHNIGKISDAEHAAARARILGGA